MSQNGLKGEGILWISIVISKENPNCVFAFLCKFFGETSNFVAPPDVYVPFVYFV